MARRFACAADDLKAGTSMTIPAAGPGEPAIAVFRTDDGDFYATADSCTHESWSLGEDSELDGHEVTCPLHLASFDIRTGKALCLPATLALQTYAVEVDQDGQVYVVAEP